jgi:hypothetical protein
MNGEGRPSGGTETAQEPAKAKASVGQIPPIGPEPGVADLLVGALMYSTVAEAAAVLALVKDEDIDPPLSTVLSAIRRLAVGRITPSPQLVLDELRRTGELTRQVAVTLMAATTTGACSPAARHYAAAVVAESLRRQVESFGAALTAAAASAAEIDLAPLAGRAATAVAGCAWRLDQLRGEATSW